MIGFGGWIGSASVPTQAAFTRYQGGDSIYGIQPVSEELARLMAERLNRAPISVYVPELHRPRPAAPLPAGDDDEEPLFSDGSDTERPEDPFGDA